MENEKKSNKLRTFLDPLLKTNPLFVLVLGTCPALAVTATFESALGMGFLFTFVLVMSNIIISALRKVIPEEVRTPAYIVIIATFVTIVKLIIPSVIAHSTALAMVLAILGPSPQSAWYARSLVGVPSPLARP